MSGSPASKPIPYPADSVVYAGVAGFMDKMWNYILFTLPPGPAVVKMRYVINFHKALMLPMFLYFMWKADNWDCDSYWQLAYQHGFYGIAWIIKDVAFGDASWLEPCTTLSALSVFAVLMVNHGAGAIVGGYNLVNHGCVTVPRAQRVTAMYMYLLGLLLMLCADVQKNVTIEGWRSNPSGRGLIKTGLYTYMRNPNFFGEILIYFSYALAIGFDYDYFYAPWIAALAVCSLLIPRMVTKDRRMARYPDFEAWSSQAGFLLPNIGAMLAGNADGSKRKIEEALR